MKGFLRSRVARGVAVIALAVALVLGSVAVASAYVPIFTPILPPIFFLFQGINGTVTDAGTTGPISGIVVSAYNASDGAYVSSAVTNASGQYSIWLADGESYLVQFRDPAGRYGEEWRALGGPVANKNDAWDFAVTSGNWTLCSISMTQAAKVQVVVQRAGHPLTVLPGKFVITQQKSLGELQQWTGTTGGDGSTTFGGLFANPATTYMESVIDPSGMFYSADVDTWHAVVGGATYVGYAGLYPAGASKEITPTVPYAKYKQNKGRTFKVSGKFSKSIANGSQIKILAVKGSTRKTFKGTIKNGVYSSKVKLSKGYWTLYALFTGNSTYAANDSLTGKTVKVR